MCICAQCYLNSLFIASMQVVSVNVEDLANSGAENNTNQSADSDVSEFIDNEDAIVTQEKAKRSKKFNRRLLGNILLDAFKSSDSSRICQFASSVSSLLT